MALKNQMWTTGRGQLDVAHPLAADPRVGHLDAAAVADHPLVLHPAVLAAGALPVLLRAEDPLAEQAVLLGPIRPVVDGLGLLDLAERPAPDVVRAGEPDLDGPVVVDTIVGTFAHAHETLSSAGPRPCRSRGGGWWVKATAFPSRWIQDGRPGCPLAHVSPALLTVRGPLADRSSGGPSDGDKKSPRADPRDTPRGPPRSKNRSSRTRNDQPAPSLTGFVGRLHDPASRTQPSMRTIAAPVASGSAPDRVASYHPTQSANQFQGKSSSQR